MAKPSLDDLSKPGLHVAIDNLPELELALAFLVKREVLVGVPEDKTERDDPESAASHMTNASLAYIHDNGAPEANIPARPFMVPGIKAIEGQAATTLGKAAEYALRGTAFGRSKVEEGYERVGMMAVNSIRKTITDGILPALADSTVAKRAAKGRKGAAEELKRRGKGLAPTLELALPLVDTAEMLKSITYVTRNKADRKS